MPTPTFPTLHVIGDNIPQAWYRAIKAIWENGLPVRTQYDRKNAAGDFIDPPSRDARVLIEVRDPFADPRYPPISHCERGTYLAEISGAKDHRVVPMKDLRRVIGGEKLDTTLWPYTYHQRLVDHPETQGDAVINQLALAIRAVAKTPFTRRAMCTTAVPNLDPFLTEDIPCLREMQLRCTEDEEGLVFCPTTTWRSRDLFKAWGDNVIAVTFLLQLIALEIGEKAEKPIRWGSYADFSCSLHIYGQDFGHVGGDEEKGLKGFFEIFPTEEDFIARSMPGKISQESEVLPQLKKLLSKEKIADWNFGTREQALIRSLIEQIESGELKV